jgi:large subunit ribosomal protein L19
MEKKIIEFNNEQRKGKKMDFQAGDVVKIHLKIKEGGKERVQVFEGIIISIGGRQSSSPKITVRKVSHGVGVEMILPLLSKNVDKIELVKKAKVRRAKLYYIRDLTTKQSRMKYKDIADYIKKEESGASVEEEIKEEKLEEVEDHGKG